MKQILLALGFLVYATSAFASNGARIYNNQNQVPPAGSNTVLTFNSEHWDDQGYHDPLLNPSRITIPMSGRYTVFGNFCWSSSSSYEMSLVQFRVNGTSIIARDQREIDTINSCTNLSTVWTFTQGDYIEVIVWHNLITGRSIYYGPSYSPEFGVELIP